MERAESNLRSRRKYIAMTKEEFSTSGAQPTPTATPTAQTKQQMDADAAKWLKIYNNPPSEKHKELAEQLLRKKGLL